MKQLLRLIELQFKEYARDPAVFIWGFVFPILMAWGLGMTFTAPLKSIRDVAWLGTDPAPKLQPARNAEFRLHSVTATEAVMGLKRGDYQLLFTRENGRYIYTFDERNQESVLSYHELKESLEPASKSQDEIKPLEVMGTRYVDFLIPGLAGMGMMMSCMWGISYLLIERRNKKLLRRLIATPMHRSYYLLSHIISRLVLSAVELGILVSFARFVFDFKIQGSYLALALVFVAGHWAFSGLAILVASRTASIDIGTGILNAITTPMMVLSGVFFSIKHFPDWAMPVVKHLPLTMHIEAMRRVMLEGGAFGVLMPELAWIVGGLALFGSICFAVGLKIYRWY